MMTLDAAEVMVRLRMVTDSESLSISAWTGLHVDIVRKLGLGWTVDEVYHFMKNTEEVSPGLLESEALSNMQAISEAVEARLKLLQPE